METSEVEGNFLKNVEGRNEFPARAAHLPDAD
jgi:hypothetical protein